ncbi:beta-galactosidase-1-like protein 2 [Hydra vulgaris]|uniref:Beta-galactosidase n=1 Tax=Hydra vulgaris TaxID=6087 RepID=A0ABM4B1F1_HYDVU
MLVSYSWIKMVITVGILMCVCAYLFLFSSFEMTSDANKIQAPEGLKINGRNFTLKREKFRIMSGSMHYFRIPFRKWSDRLLKLKAMGLNTVDIYIPWNLHEPEPGYFDFSSDQLNLSEFLYLLQGYGLYAIIRPGPYICAELDLGGLPSWLLRDKNMKLRSLYPGFIEPVERYFKQLFAILQPFQFSYGGPIIAFQIENEYGVYDHDSNYMKYLKEIYISNGLSELFFVCDNKQGLGKYKLEGVLQTINFMWLDAKGMIDKLEAVQPDKPVFVTELWDGWFDHWGENHHIVKTADAALALEYVIKRGASFNLYMFHGGTNFRFINGANANNDGLNYQSTITSYDYDAPVSETGCLSQKFEELKLTIKNNAPKGAVPKTLPWIPDDSPYTGYGMIKLTTQMDLSEILKHVNFKKYQLVVNMENLSINNYQVSLLDTLSMRIDFKTQKMQHCSLKKLEILFLVSLYEIISKSKFLLILDANVGKLKSFSNTSLNFLLSDFWSFDSEINVFIVSPEHSINCIDIVPDIHKFLILASDGLWGVMNAKQAVDIITNYERNADEMPLERNCATVLCNQSLEFWKKRHCRTVNISAVILFFDEEFGSCDPLYHDSENSTLSLEDEEDTPPLFDTLPLQNHIGAIQIIRDILIWGGGV